MKKLTALLLALASLAALFAACGTTPKTAADWLDLGEKYLLGLDYEQAVAALDRAIEIEPKISIVFPMIKPTQR
ncbi:MAG: tetratricopeptide repeat protein [Firmicutes bacterium]|nr:tetratricopeptide repeat protein [Bacillota bacterium]